MTFRKLLHTTVVLSGSSATVLGLLVVLHAQINNDPSPAVISGIWWVVASMFGIRAGAIALAAGLVLVMGYMAVFYGLFGWFANVALIANLFLQVAVLSLLEATLTLPGMAGILLTLGVAVDANILINERIREEVRAGRTPLNAMEAGFTRAFTTIQDSNATAFLSHVMLFAFGSGPVRGFAVTITVGIITTLFTATLVARLMMVRWYVRTRPALLPV